MLRTNPAFAVVAAVVAASALAGCGGFGGSEDAPTPVINVGAARDYNPGIRPENFVRSISNRYWPMTAGAHWVYESADGSERIEVTVLNETRIILGITATVVRDVVSEDGELVEDTLDWYAEDKDGNVWYLGEDSKEFKGGKLVGSGGSWEAGVDGARPGIVMRANPEVGDAYRQEYYEGEAEDMAEVIQLGGSETVRYGALKDLIVTREWTPLEPDVVEHKYYAPGIGVVLEKEVSGGTGRVELVSFQPGVK